MRKAIFVSSAVLLAAALVFAGGDPWKSKPYQQWDDKDVKRILEDSPWAKVVQVDVTWKADKSYSSGDAGGPANGPAPAGNQQTPMGGGGKSMGGGSPAPTPASNTPVAGAGSAGSSSGEANFLVRWVSSK